MTIHTYRPKQSQSQSKRINVVGVVVALVVLYIIVGCMRIWEWLTK